jgi:rRNA maturation RNase YbeY
MQDLGWFRERNLVRLLLLDIFKKEKTPLDTLSIIFCSDAYLLGINQEFLNHNTYTDIITFDLTGHRPDGPELTHSVEPKQKTKAGTRTTRGTTQAPKIGEIYISVDRVTENAAALGLDRKTELRRVMIHGCLHLCGYKDKLNADKILMRRKEDQYLSLLTKRST